MHPPFGLSAFKYWTWACENAFPTSFRSALSSCVTFLYRLTTSFLILFLSPSISFNPAPLLPCRSSDSNSARFFNLYIPTMENILTSSSLLTRIHEIDGTRGKFNIIVVNMIVNFWIKFFYFERSALQVNRIYPNYTSVNNVKVILRETLKKNRKNSFRYTTRVNYHPRPTGYLYKVYNTFKPLSRSCTQKEFPTASLCFVHLQ